MIGIVVEKFVLQLEEQVADRDVTIELSEPAKAWLIKHGYDEQMGARPMARVIQEHIKKPLADEVLFGKLKGGGHVRVVLVKDEASTEAEKEKIGFEFLEGPVTPKPEKLPVARRRRPKSSSTMVAARMAAAAPRVRPRRGLWSKCDQLILSMTKPACRKTAGFSCGLIFPSQGRSRA